jgi:hypothetical protein
MAELARGAADSLPVGVGSINADGTALGDAVYPSAEVETLAILRQHAVEKSAREHARPPHTVAGSVACRWRARQKEVRSATWRLMLVLEHHCGAHNATASGVR